MKIAIHLFCFATLFCLNNEGDNSGYVIIERVTDEDENNILFFG